MRLTAFHIDGFGVYANQTLRDISAGLTVLHGLNEAGKSTLLAFLRAIPYGFETERGPRPRYEPLAGGSHGGWIESTTRDGRAYRMARSPARRRQSGEASLLSLSDDRPLSPDELTRLLGAPREVFSSVYAFSLAELQGLESLTSEQVASRIWSAGMGQAAASISDVEAELRKLRDGMHSPKGSNPPLNQTLRRLRSSRSDLREAEEKRTQYDAKSVELDELRGRSDALSAERSRLESRLRRLTQYQNAWEAWVRLTNDRKALAELGPPLDFPPDGLARFEELRHTREGLGQQVTQLRDRIAARTKQHNELPIDTCLLDSRAAIDALAQKVGAFEGALRDLPVREQQVRTEEKQLERDLRELAAGRDEAWLKEVDVSALVTNAAREQGDCLRRAEGAVSDCRQEVARAREAAREAEAQRTEAAEARDSLPELPVGSTHDLKRRREAVAGARQALADVQSATDDGRHLEERREDLDRQRAAAEARQEVGGLSVPAWPVALIGVLAGALIALVARPPGGVIGGLVLAGAGIGVWLWMRAAQRLSRKRVVSAIAGDLERIREQLDDTERGLPEAEARLAEARHRLAACGEVVGMELRTQVDVEAAAQQLDEMRDQLAKRQSAEGAVTAAEGAIAAATRRLVDAQETLAKAQEAQEAEQGRWREWLQQRNLPPGMSPEGFNELAQGVRGLRKGLQNLEQTRSRATGIARDIEAITQQTTAVFAACGKAMPPQGELPGAIVALAADLQQSVRNRVAAEGIERELGDLQDELSRAEESLGELFRQLDELVRLAAAADPEDFRRRAEAHARQKELEQEIRRGEALLETIAGVGPERDRLELELAASLTPDDIAVETAAAEERRAEVDGELNHVHQDLGGQLREIENLETSAEIAAALQEQSNEAARLAEQVAEYGTLTAALLLLQKARRKYEEERQPLVVREAGRIMERITGGRYVDVVSPLGEPDQLRLRDQEGNQKGIDHLSTGTKQQLYVAMRLAYVTVHHASPTAEPLPLIMDEVLVNFDPGRARRAAEAIVEVAQTNQVLLFTCHPETVSLFREVDPGVSLVNIEGGALSAAP